MTPDGVLDLRRHVLPAQPLVLLSQALSTSQRVLADTDRRFACRELSSQTGFRNVRLQVTMSLPSPALPTHEPSFLLLKRTRPEHAGSDDAADPSPVHRHCPGFLDGTTGQ